MHADFAARLGISPQDMPRDDISQADTIKSLTGLAMAAHFRGDNDEAERLFREVLDLDHKLYGMESSLTAGTMNNLAIVLRVKGEYEAAEELCREAIRITRNDKDHPNAETSAMVHNLGFTLAGMGRYREASEQLAEALEAEERAIGADDVETANITLTSGSVRCREARPGFARWAAAMSALRA